MNAYIKTINSLLLCAVHYRCRPTYLYSYCHTLFKNTQQTCMNKMQMTITKEKKITTVEWKARMFSDYIDYYLKKYN